MLRLCCEQHKLATPAPYNSNAIPCEVIYSHRSSYSFQCCNSSGMIGTDEHQAKCPISPGKSASGCRKHSHFFATKVSSRQASPGSRIPSYPVLVEHSLLSLKGILDGISALICRLWKLKPYLTGQPVTAKPPLPQIVSELRIVYMYLIITSHEKTMILHSIRVWSSQITALAASRVSVLD